MIDGWWSGESGAEFAQRGLAEALACQDMLAHDDSPRRAARIPEAIAAVVQRLRRIVSRRSVQPAATQL